MSNKTYVGSAKAIKTKEGNSFLSMSFSKKDLDVLYQNLNQSGYVNLNVSRRREVSQYGQTHSISINDWTPNKQQGINQAQQAAQAPNSMDDFDDSDIPF